MDDWSSLEGLITAAMSFEGAAVVAELVGMSGLTGCGDAIGSSTETSSMSETIYNNQSDTVIEQKTPSSAVVVLGVVSSRQI